jgi:hypothetical protein
MAGEKKYFRRPDIGLVLEIDAVLLEILRIFLDQAGIPYEVLDAPPEEEGGENLRRRRSS